ncbi:hypothetical protein [Rheinheimera metallidurans]|uniref:hypothetical protein n=1 Tax=Rheinheimera metallidurans TaxID=2925781 RepID=UPI003001DB38
MDTLRVKFQNCYGITDLEEYEFDFRAIVKGKNRTRAYAIYAPNGTMKSSFSKSFFDLQNRMIPKEEVYFRQPIWSVLADGTMIDQSMIYVLKADIDISKDAQSVTNILVNPEDKIEYDELVVELEKCKSKVLNKLNKLSKHKKDLIESTITNDFKSDSLTKALIEASKMNHQPLIEGLIYEEIFHEKAISIFESKEFSLRAKDFSERYEELFTDASTIYRKGIFSPAKADASLKALQGQGYFDGGHRVHFEGDASSLSEDEFKQRLADINRKLDEDVELKKLRSAISQNIQTQAISNFLEHLSNEQIEFLIENVKSSKRAYLKQLLWAHYVSNTSEVADFLTLHESTEANIQAIEHRASKSILRWENAISLFNDRFVDMPFSLRLDNPSDAVLGRQPAKLVYIFNDGQGEEVALNRADLKTLSQGEKRALYLLNFIFDVEERRELQQETLFIIDDVADSFDYKNKHAIVQYLNDLTHSDFFHQIILTHNFDFYRAVTNLFVHRERSLMTSKSSHGITLLKADGVNNVFIKKWKPQVSKCEKTLCASVPFIRNLIEYTRGEENEDFLKLTKILHYKEGSDQISEGDFYRIWNKIFDTNYTEDSQRGMFSLILNTAEQLIAQDSHDGICLEDKVVLSIAIRLIAEKAMVQQIRSSIGDPNYWFQGKSQFGNLINKYIKTVGVSDTTRILEQVGVTVSSNIHLNSFMYEPILDLSIEHLIILHQKVKSI